MTDDDRTLVVRTSEKNWLTRVGAAYRARQALKLQDDANLGINPKTDTVLQMGIRAGLGAREWSAVFISLGMAALGAWLMVMAVLDPEPYSKVASAIATGAVLVGSGGFMAVRILSQLKPPHVKVSAAGVFEISWD